MVRVDLIVPHTGTASRKTLSFMLRRAAPVDDIDLAAKQLLQRPSQVLKEPEVRESSGVRDKVDQQV
jgi:hypothetical protein